MYVQFAGKGHNFNTSDDTTSSSLGVPYDYSSMMHYSKTAFKNGTEPTIVTKIPAFSDIIGQRMEFSDSDLLKLNRLYNCSKIQQSVHKYYFIFSIIKVNLSCTCSTDLFNFMFCYIHQ